MSHGTRTNLVETDQANWLLQKLSVEKLERDQKVGQCLYM